MNQQGCDYKKTDHKHDMAFQQKLNSKSEAQQISKTSKTQVSGNSHERKRKEQAKTLGILKLEKIKFNIKFQFF